MSAFINWLIVTINPRYWLRNTAMHPAWDRYLRGLLADGEHFTNIGKHTAIFGGREIWISNFPYASFTMKPLEHMATRRTVRLMRLRLNEDYYRQYSKGLQ